MILVDANLLLYAALEEMPQHPPARCWLESTLSEAPKVGLPWPSLLAFLRIATNPRVFDRPPSLSATWRLTQRWLELDNVWIPAPTDRHGEIFSRMLPAVSRPSLVTDAHLATLALEHGLKVCTTDRDFGRFPGLRWENPLA